MSVIQTSRNFILVQEENYSLNKTLSVGKLDDGRVSFSLENGGIAIITADDFKAIIEHLGAPQIAEILGLGVTG